MKNRQEKLRENELTQKIDQEINKKVDEIVEGKLEREIGADVDKELKKQIEGRVHDAVTERLEPGELLTERPSSVPLNRRFADVRKVFVKCWDGACRRMTFLMVGVYIIIAGLFALCFFLRTGFCISNGTLFAAPYIVIAAVAAVISLFFSFFSESPRVAFIFSLLLDIPVVLFLLVYFVSYIAIFLIFIVFFIRFIQGARRR